MEVDLAQGVEEKEPAPKKVPLSVSVSASSRPAKSIATAALRSMRGELPRAAADEEKILALAMDEDVAA